MRLLPALSALTLVTLACGSVEPPEAVLTPSTPATVLALESNNGCLIDTDCTSGSFCFQGRCSVECVDDTGCAAGERCSAHGRCLDPELEAQQWQGTSPADGGASVPGGIDEEAAAAVIAEAAGVEVVEPPPTQIEVLPGQPFVEVHLRTATPVPGGAVLYRVELDGPGTSSSKSLRAEGTQAFRFLIPTGAASGERGEAEVQRAYLVTSLGGYHVSLVPRIGVDGVYAGEIAIREFGGSAIPIRFGLRVVPSDASFEEATERYLLLPTSTQDLFAPVRDASGAAWVERPLEFDAQAGVHFARFAHPFAIAAGSQYSGSGDVVRTLRLEIVGIEGRRVLGAVADRWLGLYDGRTADGVPTPGAVVLSGQMTAHRVSPLPAEARTAPLGQGAVGVPGVGGALPITACAAPVLSSLLSAVQPPAPADGSAPPEGPCHNVGSASAFAQADSARKAHCALALADEALQGPSTAAQVRAFLDSSLPNPGGLSFGEFLERCAALDGYCVPTEALLCTQQLLAHAYQTQTAELTEAGALLEAYQQVAREGYLGRQLAAFQVDTNTRLEWLQKSEAPLFLAQELRAYNEDVLSRWETQVLDAHFDVLASQFDPAGLDVLARAPTDPIAQSVRTQMLLELAQTWQGAMEALQIATQRWNSLYQDDLNRARTASLVRTRMVDLYLSAATLSQLNRSSGSAGNNAVFGSGFAALLRSLEELSLPFNDLVFMRDAEVVVSRSVDPSEDNRTLLGDLEELARRAVADAQDSVDRVLADAQSSEVNAQVLTDRMLTQAEELGSELVSICGLPRGCTPSDVGVRPECAVQVEVGRCGFVRDPLTGEYASFDAIGAQENVSEAGAAILRYREAVLGQRIAEEEFRANQERAAIELASAEAFATKVQDWDAQRRQTWSESQSLLNEMTALNVETMNVELETLVSMQRRRQQAYDVQAASAAEWAKIRYEGVEKDMRLMTSIMALQQTGAWLTLTGNEIDRLAETTAEGFPKAAGTSVDIAAPARFVIGMSAYGATTAMRAVQQALDTTAATIELTMAEEQARRDAKLEELADLAALDAQQTENDLAALASNLRSHELRAQHEIRTREALIDALRRNLELDLAHDRDLVELRDRRDKVQLRLAESSALRIQVLRSEVTAARQQQEYLQVVQRAQLLKGRHASLVTRLENLNVLIASPSVIFAFANRLARAESRVDRAKGLLFDWVVALEYHAVRPFIDQRLAILLARNPSQLEAIANDLVRLERACGGIVNYEVTDLSVRDDLLRVGFNVGGVDGQPGVSAAERFRSVLRRGNVPIDTQVRYSTDERIGDLVASRKVLAATFSIRLDDFANLPLTCNAKLASLDVQLVGESLGRARPTVSILYDGTSRLRSCQPNIDDLVGGLDPGTTSFGRLTEFRTAGRSVSPLANVGDFGAEDSANRGLEGLPLASTYTLLIDPAAGENRHIDWNALEDVKLRLTYAYQDVFPVGQCQ